MTTLDFARTSGQNVLNYGVLRGVYGAWYSPEFADTSEKAHIGSRGGVRAGPTPSWPGVHRCAVTCRSRRMEANNQTFEGSLFEERLKGMFRGPADRSQYKEPDEVAEAVLHALFDENPKRRYMVVPNQREAEITIRKAIEELVQLNEGHTYTYDRASLIAMLDEALAASGR